MTVGVERTRRFYRYDVDVYNLFQLKLGVVGDHPVYQSQVEHLRYQFREYESASRLRT